MGDVPELGAEGSIAFVASLLPAAFLVEHAGELQIRRLIVSDPALLPSYERVAAALPPPVVLESVPRWSIAAATRIARRMAAAKRRRQTVIFFHECCWPIFDLLADAIAPSAVFCPQVTMSAFEPVHALPPPTTWASALKQQVFRFVRHKFEIYRTPQSSTDGSYDYFVTYRAYGRSVVTRPPAARRELARRNTVAPAGPPAVIFVGGTEPVADDYLRDIYASLMRVAREAGLSVRYKDHPLHRLNVPCASEEIIDAAIPVELVDTRFAVSIGVGSTGLLAVGDRKISIVNALDKMPNEARRLRVNHLRALPGGNQIEFVSDLTAVSARLRAVTSA